VGRQPWVVYGLLKTSDGVSVTVPAYQVALTLLLFMGIYTLLGYAFIFILMRKIKAGPQPLADEPEQEARS